jgi:hypothetical protein
MSRLLAPILVVHGAIHIGTPVVGPGRSRWRCERRPGVPRQKGRPLPQHVPARNPGVPLDPRPGQEVDGQLVGIAGAAPVGRIERWLAFLSVALAVTWVIQRLVPDQSDPIAAFAAPDRLPLAAAGFAAAGITSLGRSAPWLRVRSALRWTALLLMLWAASGLPFDLLTAAGLVGHRTAAGDVVLSTVYWPGLATRAVAFAAVVVLARLTLGQPAAPESTRPPAWSGYVAFVLALPYPLLRVHWALGGTIGLMSPGGAGAGWEPLLIAIPWALAAVLSLLLVSPPRWMPRRLLLAAGWSATAIVAMIGPAAFCAFVLALASGGEMATGEIDLWVFGLFYGSWFLWAIAGGAATRAYQLRSAPPGHRPRS